MSNKLIRRDLTAPENHQNAAIHLAEDQIADFFQKDGNTVIHRAILPDGSITDIAGDPITDLAQLTDESGLLAAKANTSALINPGITTAYEVIYVGSTRAIKTLSAAYDYMLKKAMTCNKGFQLKLDSETFTGSITWQRVNMIMESADTSNPATITGSIAFQYSPLVILRNFNVQSGSIDIYENTYASLDNINISSPTAVFGLRVAHNAYANCNRLNITGTQVADTYGLLVGLNAAAWISNTSISRFHSGIRVSHSSNVTCETGSVTIDSCTFGIYAWGNSHVYAPSTVVTVTNTTMDFVPAINTTGSANSYIQR